MTELTIVRENMMKDVNYMGYCGNAWNAGCSMPRTVRHGDQFRCPECGWVSQYPQDFIDRYRLKHNLNQITQ